MNFLKCFISIIVTIVPSLLQADELEKVVSILHDSTFKANIEIIVKNSSIKGTLYYQKSKFHLKLSDGRIIASDSRKVMVYNPDTMVSGKQDISLAGGLGWILDYHRKIEGKKAIIEPKNESNYKKIIVSWNDHYFPTTIQFYTEKDLITYRFSNLSFLNNIQASLFSFKPPPGSRNVDNPLNLKK